jgi:hypothetical protein
MGGWRSVEEDDDHSQKILRKGSALAGSPVSGIDFIGTESTSDIYKQKFGGKKLMKNSFKFNICIDI